MRNTKAGGGEQFLLLDCMCLAVWSLSKDLSKSSGFGSHSLKDVCQLSGFGSYPARISVNFVVGRGLARTHVHLVVLAAICQRGCADFSGFGFGSDLVRMHVDTAVLSAVSIREFTECLVSLLSMSWRFLNSSFLQPVHELRI